MIYNLFSWFDIGYSIQQAIRTGFGYIAALLYNFIVDLYNIFHTLSTVNVVDNEYVQKVYTRVGLILGVFMLFKLVFSLIQTLLEPDKINDKNKGAVAIVKRSVISIVLLGVTPSLFNMAFDLQKIIVGNVGDSSNVLYRFISDEYVYYDTSTFGQNLASTLFFSFYTNNVGDDYWTGISWTEHPDTHIEYVHSNRFVDIKDKINKCDWTGSRKDENNVDCSFYSTVDYLSLRSLGVYVIKWDGLFSIIVAGITIWILVMYCLQVAIRAIQLAYLQLIAPVPILSYISDPEGSFKKWVNQSLSTYLDLFVRLLVIYFVITICGKINIIFDSAIGNDLGLDPNTPYIFWIRIFMIIGLLLFGKKVPELLKDLFPNMGGGAGKFSFGLKAPDALKKPVKGLATFGTGVAVGGIAGMASGIRHGEGWHKLIAAPGGLLRGAASARTKGSVIGNAKKGLSNVRTANAKAYDRHHDGSTFWGRINPNGAQQDYDSFERELQLYNKYDSITKFVSDELKKAPEYQVAEGDFNYFREHGVTRNAMTINGTHYNAGDVIADGDRIEAARVLGKRVKDAEKSALEYAINSNDTKIINALSTAEAIRQKGIDNGYKGFNSESITDTNKSVSDRVDSFLDNKNSTKEQIHEIQDAGGSRNSKYEKAKSNAKYNKK